MSAGPSLLVLTNPDAGGADSESVRVVLDVLRAAARVKVASVTGQDDLRRALERRGRKHPVVLGGDDTLHHVVQELYRLRDLAGTPIALVPLGTGNDLARNLGLPLDPIRAARGVLDGEERPLDLIVDDAGGVAVNAVHVGIGAEATRLAGPAKPRLGRLGFPAGSALTGLRQRRWRLRVEADSRVIVDVDDPVLMVGVANNPTLAGGAGLLTPDARPDDGLADIVVSGAVGPLARLGYAVGMRRGGHLRHPDVAVARARSVTVTGQDFLYNADGELFGPVRRRTWTVEPRAWRLTVPRTAGTEPG